MKPYPVMMNVCDQAVTVVGGGKVALRKVSSLVECGARVTVIAPEVEPELEELSAKGTLEWIGSAFEESFLDAPQKPVLVFGTTNRRDVNVLIHKASVERGIPCNIADVPDLCTFTVPAVLRRGDLIVAVSTGGCSPALSRRIREELESMYGPEYAVMTGILGDLRRQIVTEGASSAENREFFFRLVDSELVEALKTGDVSKAVEVLRSVLPDRIDPESAVRRSMQQPGTEG